MMFPRREVVMVLLIASAVATFKLDGAGFNSENARTGDLSMESCEMNSNYSDNIGVVYMITKSGWSVSAVPVFVPKGAKIGWIYANGTINPQTLRLTMVFNYTTKTDTVVGTLRWECSEIDYDNRATWVRPDPSLKTIHLVYMTHLDVGFTNGARNVCDTYFNDHFPKAMETAAALRKLGGEERFVYTEFPWLIHEYLTGAAGCAHEARTPEQIEDLKAAIKAGDISWHALSLNILTELYAGSHFNWSLGNKDTLNRMLGKKNGMRCGKHSDVTGMSISVVPYLAGHSVNAIHIGYNAACMFPEVPSVFRWQHGPTGTEVIVMAEHTYGRIIRIQPAADTALIFMYTSDNQTPPNSTQVLQFWANLRQRYPAAAINTDSPFDSFTSVLTKIRDQLPIVSQEIGNSWLYGAPADPYRISSYRTAISALDDAVDSGRLDANNPAVDEFKFRLMKPMEHNWGLSIGQYLPQLRDKAHGNWSNKEFYAVRNRSDYQRLEEEWREQNLFCFPVKEHQQQQLSERHSSQWEEFMHLLTQRLEKLRNPPDPTVKPDEKRQEQLQSHNNVFKCYDRYSIGFNATDGSVTSLIDMKYNKTWLDSSNAAAVFRYRTYSMEDFDNFNRGYNPGCGPPCGDFSKSGMDKAGAESVVWKPVATVYDANVDTCEFSMLLSLPSVAYTMYGAPQKIQMIVKLSVEESEPAGTMKATSEGDTIQPALLSLRTTVSWKEKPATRLAEAMFLSFDPIVPNPSQWHMDILGYPVSPLDVVVDGTRHIHAVWSGVSYQDSLTRVNITTSHTPLVSPGDIDHLLNFDGMTQPNMEGGWHFNLYNNLWGTAFPQWNDENGVAEFTIEFGYLPTD